MGEVHKIFSEKLLGHEIFRSMFSWKICKLLRPPSYVLNVRSLTCFSWISTWHELLNWNYTFFIDFTVQKTKVKFAFVLITKILISSSSPAEKSWYLMRKRLLKAENCQIKKPDFWLFPSNYFFRIHKIHLLQVFSQK